MPEHVRFLALAEEYHEVESEVATRFARVLATQSFVLGKETSELEAAMVRLTGTRHAVAVSSGSDALFLALRALDVGRDTAVLVPSYTFIASAGAVVHAGAVPVFTDVDRGTLNVGVREIEAALRTQFVARDGAHFHLQSGAKLCALLVVHLFGRMAAMREITALAARLGIHVIEDAAQAIGAIGDSGPAGAAGAAGCFSFYPTKNLGGAGDGGVVTTNDDERARRLARLRVHGADGAALQKELGINARMGELQAAYLNAKWRHLEAWNRERDALAAPTRAAWPNCRQTASSCRPSSALRATCTTSSRSESSAGVASVWSRRSRRRGSRRACSTPRASIVSLAFGDYGAAAQSLPVTDAAADEVLCLPIHPFLGEHGVAAVCDALARALRS